MSKKLLATQRLINSVWSLVYELTEDGKVNIISHGRDNKDGYTQEGKVDQFRIREDKNRTALSVVFAPADPFDFNEDRELQVANPKHIFDYE